MTGSALTPKPLIIAHRGASGLYPEHTLEGYEKAFEMGADYIEPDLSLTKDGVIIARHDIYLSTTTNIATHPEFAKRKRYVKELEREDWLTVDLTLAEIKTLRAIQPREGRSKQYDGQFSIPTLAEIITLTKAYNAKHGTHIGIYTEPKHPSLLKAMGFDFAKSLIALLHDEGVDQGQIPIYLQSFEMDFLYELKALTPLPLVYLIEDGNRAKIISDIKQHHEILAGLGPYKALLRNWDGTPSLIMKQANKLGLLVHPWTFRDDDIGFNFKSGEEEMLSFFELGVDGLFTDFADTGVRARAKFLDKNKGKQ